MFDFVKIAEITTGKILAQQPVGTAHHFLTDSRKIVNPRAAIFVAIRGHQHDGHRYLNAVHRQGVRNYIVENKDGLSEQLLVDSNVLLVKDSINALQQIAANHRQQFDFPVVGITGSNGKTIVKEWLGQLLAERYKMVKSPGSYNSQLGVPLSVLQMTAWNDLGIFEAGISTTREMGRLQKVMRPTLGIFTNLGPAHDEGFVNQDQKAAEKWELFRECSRVIHCLDHEIVNNHKPAGIQTFTWGKGNDADVQLVESTGLASGTILHVRFRGDDWKLKVPFSEEASLENVMHCISMMTYLGIPMDEIQEGLTNLANVDHRLSVKRGVNNCYLVDDSYSNDLAGLQIAIDFMKSRESQKRTVILSDVLQSGMDEEILFGRINDILSANGIQRLIGIGPGMLRNKHVFQQEASFYASTDGFLKQAKPEAFRDESILIKGARTFEFERITTFLSEKVHGTVLEINLEALNNNLNFYRSRLREGVKMMVMVKASAYGSGSHEIAGLLQHNRVDYLSVAYPDEGVELRKRGIHLPMMVMNAAPDSFGNILKFGLEPEIYSLSQLRSLIQYVRDKQTAMNIHLKIDTGMHRLGFEAEQLEDLMALLHEAPFLKVVSVYSHLAGADERVHNAFSRQQVEKFLTCAQQLENGLGHGMIKHILNSAGILRFPEYQLDMVRLGIGLYGFEANRQEQQHLQPISTLKTVISQIRDVKKGETVGYGRKGKVTKNSRIATIAIGYADGFSRRFSNGNISLSVNGKPAPVIGNVCMDMTMLDVTDIDAREGDEVIVFGQKPSIRDLADAAGTIPYEILTSISSRVTRVFYSG